MIYVNDLQEGLKSYLKLMLVDDTILMRENNGILRTSDNLQREPDRLRHRSDKWLMKFSSNIFGEMKMVHHQ